MPGHRVGGSPLSSWAGLSTPLSPPTCSHDVRTTALQSLPVWYYLRLHQHDTVDAVAPCISGTNDSDLRIGEKDSPMGSWIRGSKVARCPTSAMGSRPSRAVAWLMLRMRPASCDADGDWET